MHFEKIKKKGLNIIMNKEQEILNHKTNALKIFSDYLDGLIRDNKTQKKADLLSYWIEDYTKYLKNEDNFNPLFYKKYERGDIIKANLGFNVGSEEGRTSLLCCNRYVQCYKFSNINSSSTFFNKKRKNTS